MKKIFTYDDLPPKKMGMIVQRCDDEVILKYLNEVAKNSSLLVSIEERTVIDEEKKGAPKTSITFTLLVRRPE